MFEWKILAAILAVLIVSSSALVSNTGIKDLFMNSTGDIGNWVKSPFGSLFSTPEKTENFVKIIITTDTVPIEINSPANITSATGDISNFMGRITFNLKDNMSVLAPADSDIHMNLALKNTKISDVYIDHLALGHIGYVVVSESSNITGNDESIEITGFRGIVSVTDSAVELDGNVSAVKNGKWSIG